MSRRIKTAAQSSDKFKRGVTGAGPAYTQGVQQSGSWVEGALSAAPRRDAGLQRAIAEGRIDHGIQAKGDAGWRNATLAKGPQNYQASVATAGPAYESAMAKQLSIQAQAKQATANMDTSTRAGRLAKMVAHVQFVADANDAMKAGK